VSTASASASSIPHSERSKQEGCGHRRPYRRGGDYHQEVSCMKQPLPGRNSSMKRWASSGLAANRASCTARPR
jgi:hypothetical protein